MATKGKRRAVEQDASRPVILDEISGQSKTGCLNGFEMTRVRGQRILDIVVAIRNGLCDRTCLHVGIPLFQRIVPVISHVRIIANVVGQPPPESECEVIFLQVYPIVAVPMCNKPVERKKPVLPLELTRQHGVPNRLPRHRNISDRRSKTA